VVLKEENAVDGLIPDLALTTYFENLR